MTPLDLPTSLLVALAALVAMTAVLCGGYAVLSAFSDEAIERLCQRIFG